MVVLVLFFPFDTIVTWCKTSNAVRLDVTYQAVRHWCLGMVGVIW